MVVHLLQEELQKKLSSTQMLEEVEAELEEADLESVVEIKIGSKLKKSSPMEEGMVTLEEEVLLFLCSRVLLALTTKKRKTVVQPPPLCVFPHCVCEKVASETPSFFPIIFTWY